MASNASYLDVRSMIFSRSIIFLLVTIYEYHVFLYAFTLDLKLILVAEG